MSKKNILIKTNILVCLIVLAGFPVNRYISYRANAAPRCWKMEQITDPDLEGVLPAEHNFIKPVNVSPQCMANDGF